MIKVTSSVVVRETRGVKLSIRTIRVTGKTETKDSWNFLRSILNKLPPPFEKFAY
jgi:hypothetical protein